MGPGEIERESQQRLKTVKDMQQILVSGRNSEKQPERIENSSQQLHRTRETVRDSQQASETLRDIHQLRGTGEAVRDSHQP